MNEKNEALVKHDEDTFMSAYKERQLEDLKQAIIGMDEASIITDEIKEATIPEEYFRKIYLPMLAGIPEQYHIVKVTMDDWYGVSGGPRNKVKVISPRGEVLFTVPAIVPIEVRDVAETEKDRSYNTILEYTKGFMDHKPMEAERIQQQEMARMAGKMNKKNVDDYKAEWIPVFGYYGFLSNVKPTIDVAAYFREVMGIKTETKTNSEEDNEDIFIWE